MVIACGASSQGTVTSVEPLGPNPVGAVVSSAISTEVASSVSQDTDTVALTAPSQSRSPTSNDVTSASGVALVSVVSVVAGQLVSSTVPSVRVVPHSTASSRFVSVMVAPVRFARVRSASDRSASMICAPARFDW